MNATLTLSTVGRQAELAEAGHRADLVADGVSTVVAVRFSVRGCRGDNGADRDLRGVTAPDGLGVVVASLFLLDTGCAVAFAASVNDLNAALITWVASISLSFEDSSPPAVSFGPVRALGLAGGRLVVVFFVAILVADAGLDSGIRSSRRVTVVADVQVVVDDTAAFTASALVVRDVMSGRIQNHLSISSQRRNGHAKLVSTGAKPKEKKKMAKRC